MLSFWQTAGASNALMSKNGSIVHGRGLQSFGVWNVEFGGSGFVV